MMDSHKVDGCVMCDCLRSRFQHHDTPHDWAVCSFRKPTPIRNVKRRIDTVKQSLPSIPLSELIALHQTCNTNHVIETYRKKHPFILGINTFEYHHVWALLSVRCSCLCDKTDITRMMLLIALSCFAAFPCPHRYGNIYSKPCKRIISKPAFNCYSPWHIYQAYSCHFSPVESRTFGADRPVS